jgi:hypothetical protein
MAFSIIAHKYSIVAIFHLLNPSFSCFYISTNQSVKQPLHLTISDSPAYEQLRTANDHLRDSDEHLRTAND